MNAAHPDHAHLDAETLAAWIDGGLDAAALVAAEAHVSNCERCQSLVATTMKTLPAEAAPAPAGVRLWRWWLAPIAAATAAVVVWAVVPQRSIDSVAERSIEQVAPKTESAPAIAPQTASPTATAPQAEGARENAQPQFRAEPQKPPAPQRQQKLADAPSRPSESDPRAAAANREARADAVAPAAPPFAPVPTPAPVPAPAALPSPAAAAAAGAPKPAAAPPAATAEAAVARDEVAPKRAAALAGAPAPADLQMRMRQAVPIDVVSPDPARRWRVAADRSLERTEDGGRTWRQVRSAQGDTITSGSAPSAAVCWIVGGNGLVLLTTDGNRFARIAFPAQVDLTSVTATDARRATVTTADGRTFTTDDGGATWRQ